MLCARCGSENPAGKKFCGDCGAQLHKVCPDCGAFLLDSWRFCRDCGLAVDAAAPATAFPARIQASPRDGLDPAGRAQFQRDAVDALSARTTEVSETTQISDRNDVHNLGRRTLSAGSKFVGRDFEIAEMKRALELAGSGRGQIVAVSGEGGVGKSRLLHQFKSTLEPGWLVLEATSYPSARGAAYSSTVDLLNEYFDIAPDGDPAKRCKQVRDRVLALDRRLQDAIPAILELLGISDIGNSGEQINVKTQRPKLPELIARIMLRESLRQPLMLIVDDLQWVDAETQSWLDLLADSLESSKLLLLVSYSPEFSDHWKGKFNYTRLRLDSLSGEQAEVLLTGSTAFPEWHPGPEFKFSEQEIVEPGAAHVPSFFRDLDLGQFEFPSFRPSQDPNLAAFFAITAMLLVSMAFLSRDLIEDLQSLLRFTFG